MTAWISVPVVQLGSRRIVQPVAITAKPMIAITLTTVRTGPSVSWAQPVAINAGNVRRSLNIHIMGLATTPGVGVHMSVADLHIGGRLNHMILATRAI